MLMIKLSKIGKTNKKVFRLIISEKGRDPYGRALEILGSYNPYSKDLQVKTDRVKHWLSKGAGMTETINNLLVGKGIIEGKKVKASKVGVANEKRATQLKSKADKQAAAKKEVEAPVVKEVEENVVEAAEKTEEKKDEEVAVAPEESTEVKA
ncbi:MAG: 30S ribosomal protein S16 [Patescibacteria group bacterium]|nr:30S ribosomal protein S16 [Patescibacteria group bacterium]